MSIPTHFVFPFFPLDRNLFGRGSLRIFLENMKQKSLLLVIFLKCDFSRECEAKVSATRQFLMCPKIVRMSRRDRRDFCGYALMMMCA